MDIGSLTGEIAIEDQFSSALEMVVHKVESFAGEFTGALGGVSVAVGATVAVLGGMVAAVTALGVKGSTLLGVEDAFDRLAESAGTTGAALRGKLSEGLKYTVDDMDLMQSTTRLLSSGMKLSEEQALLMGQASRELGKATGGDATTGLDKLSGALQTGRVRGLQQQIGLIDIKKGQEEYAQSVGLTVSQLDAEGKLAGSRLAIFSATHAWLERLGVSQESFKERIDQAEVAVKKWVNNLAMSVASSKDVNDALSTVGSMLGRVFGSSSDALMSSLTSGIDAFARGVKAAVPYIESFANYLKGVWAVYVDLVPVLKIAGAAVLGYYAAICVADVATTLFTATEALLSGEMGTFAIATTAATWTVNAFALAVGALAAGYALGTWLEQNTKWGRELSDAFEYASLRMQGYSAAEADSAIALEHSMEAAKKRAESTKTATEAVKEGTETEKAATAAMAAAKAVQEAFDKSVQGVVDSVVKARSEIGVTTAAFTQMAKAQQIYSLEAQQVLIPALDKIIAQHRSLTEAEKNYYDMVIVSNTNIRNYEEQMLALKEVRLEDISALKAQGLSEAELAVAFGTTIGVMKSYEGQLEKLKELDRTLEDQRIKLHGTATDQELLDNKRAYDDATSLMNRRSAFYSIELDKQATARKQADQMALLDMQALRDGSMAMLQETADKAYATFMQMSTSSDLFSHQALGEMKERMYETREAARGMGDEFVSAAERAANAQKVVQAELDLTKKKAEAAARAANLAMGNQFTYDLTTKEGVAQYRAMNTGMDITWSDDQLMAFAQQGGTLQQLMQMGIIRSKDLRGFSSQSGSTGSGPIAPPTVATMQGGNYTTPTSAAPMSGSGSNTYNVTMSGLLLDSGPAGKAALQKAVISALTSVTLGQRKLG